MDASSVLRKIGTVASSLRSVVIPTLAEFRTTTDRLSESTSVRLVRRGVRLKRRRGRGRKRRGGGEAVEEKVVEKVKDAREGEREEETKDEEEELQLKQKQTLHLSAIVVHRGAHYTAVLRDVKTHQWFWYDDSPATSKPVIKYLGGYEEMLGSCPSPAKHGTLYYYV